MPRKEALIGLRGRFGEEIGGDDIEDILEVLGDPERADDVVSVLSRTRGEDELSPGQGSQRGAPHRVRRQARMVDVMGKIEEGFGRNALVDHEAAQRRPVALVVVLLNSARSQAIDTEMVRDPGRDPIVDLLPEIGVMRIKRVVEIEDPSLYLRKVAHFGRALETQHLVHRAILFRSLETLALER